MGVIQTTEVRSHKDIEHNASLISANAFLLRNALDPILYEIKGRAFHLQNLISSSWIIYLLLFCVSIQFSMCEGCLNMESGMFYLVFGLALSMLGFVSCCLLKVCGFNILYNTPARFYVRVE